MLREPEVETTPTLGIDEEEGKSGRRRLPVLTLVLCGVNLLLWLIGVLVGGSTNLGGLIWGVENFPILLALGAKVSIAISAGEYWRLITAMFLHVNLVHLAVNTYALLLLGGFIEALYGRRRLLILYVMSGLCGNALSYLMNPHPSMGASTAISGLFGAVMVFWWKYRAAMAPEYWERMGRHLFGVLFINLVLGAVISLIDGWGHIGGLIGGIGVAALAESRLSGELGREREWLPVPLALATVIAMLGYSGLQMAQSSARQIPLYRAYALMTAGRGEEAEPIFRRVLRSQPNDPLLLNNLAYLYADTLNRNLDEALVMAQRATKAMPESGTFWDTLGWVHYRSRRYDEAFTAMREAVRLEPGVPELRYHMGAVQEARGDRAAAIREYREALRLKPDLAVASRALQRLERL